MDCIDHGITESDMTEWLSLTSHHLLTSGRNFWFPSVSHLLLSLLSLGVQAEAVKSPQWEPCQCLVWPSYFLWVRSWLSLLNGINPRLQGSLQLTCLLRLSTMGSTQTLISFQHHPCKSQPARAAFPPLQSLSGRRWSSPWGRLTETPVARCFALLLWLWWKSRSLGIACLVGETPGWQVIRCMSNSRERASKRCLRKVSLTPLRGREPGLKLEEKDCHPHLPVGQSFVKCEWKRWVVVFFWAGASRVMRHPPMTGPLAGETRTCALDLASLLYL